MMYNMDYRYVYLSKRVWKEITKIIKEKRGVKYQDKIETFFQILLCISSYHYWWIVVNNI